LLPRWKQFTAVPILLSGQNCTLKIITATGLRSRTATRSAVAFVLTDLWFSLRHPCRPSCLQPAARQHCKVLSYFGTIVPTRLARFSQSVCYKPLSEGRERGNRAVSDGAQERLHDHSRTLHPTAGRQRESRRDPAQLDCWYGNGTEIFLATR
jgi:hypothetical protein